MITINRKSSILDKEIPYNVFINNKLVGSIKDNEKINFNLDPSDNNKIQIKGPKRISSIITFNINNNQVIEFSCVCNKKKNVFLDLIRIIMFKKNIEFKLEKDFYL